jgi:hypothetical protein
MYRRVTCVSLLLVLFALVWTTAPARAAGASCVSDPVSGPPGTTFQIVCSGFSSNTHVNAYVVEPDGRAISAGQVVGFDSNVGGGSILTTGAGNASFAWHSQDGRIEQPGGGAFAHQLGAWTWVVHELGPAQTIVAQGQATVMIDAFHWEQTGASLHSETADHALHTFSGAGFWRDEYVNIWVTLPIHCSGRANVEGASADDPLFQGLFDGFIGPNTVKANERGEIAFSILFTSRACRGYYQVTVHALGSGYGAITEIAVGGNEIIETFGVSITAVPDSIDALYPILTLLGNGWGAYREVNCWSTRPDGRSFNLGTAKADAAGHFAWDVHISNTPGGPDSFSPFASEEPGLWSITCRAPASGDTALTRIMVHALTSDP